MQQDVLRRFSFDGLPVRGQWVRLTHSLVDAWASHDYPPAVEQLLSEMFAAVTLFADNFKFDGSVSLQTKGFGLLSHSLVECREQKYLRGMAALSSQAEANHAAKTHDSQTVEVNNPDLRSWLGEQGTLAMSLIPSDNPQLNTYQGLISIQAASLEENLQNYFTSSEQLPTHLMFAYTPGEADQQTPTVTGLLLQRLPSTDMATEIELEQHAQGWHTITTLAQTLSTGELAKLPIERLLNSLFSELACRIYEPREIEYRCTCSRKKTDATLLMLGQQDLDDLRHERDTVDVSCELCGHTYTYDAIDLGQLIESTASIVTPNITDDDTVH